MLQMSHGSLCKSLCASWRNSIFPSEWILELQTVQETYCCVGFRACFHRSVLQHGHTSLQDRHTRRDTDGTQMCRCVKRDSCIGQKAAMTVLRQDGASRAVFPAAFSARSSLSHFASVLHTTSELGVRLSQTILLRPNSTAALCAPLYTAARFPCVTTACSVTSLTVGRSGGDSHTQQSEHVPHSYAERPPDWMRDRTETHMSWEFTSFW